MSTNGNGQSVRDIYRRSAENVAAVNRSYGDEFGAPVSSPPKFADMSSQQRSASMDNIAAHMNDITKQVNELTRAVDALLARSASMEQILSILIARVNALEDVTAQRWNLALYYRLRWLLTGK